MIVPSPRSVSPGSAVLRDGSLPLTADWDAGSFEIRAQTFESDVATGTAPLVVASTTLVTNLNADTVDGADLNDSGTGSSDLWSASKIASYVGSVAAGLDPKESVRLRASSIGAGTYNATGGTSARGQLTGMSNANIDGVAPAGGNRILLDTGTAAAGIWVITTLGTGADGVWDRAADFDTDAEVTTGAFLSVAEGTTYGDTWWFLTTNDPIIIGGGSGTSLTWTQFSGLGQITAGAGLTKTGNTLDVVGTSNRITVNADSVDIAATYVGQTSITTLGTITTGTWTGTTIAVANGGTGSTSAAAARVALLPSMSGNTLKVLRVNAGETDYELSAGAAGDVVGPASSVDNAIPRFDGTTGKLLQSYTSGTPTVDDNGNVAFNAQLTVNDGSYAAYFASENMFYRATADVSGVIVRARKSRGSMSSRAAISSGDLLLQLDISGYVGGSGTDVVGAQLLVTEVGTVSDAVTGLGAKLEFLTRQTGGSLAASLTLYETGKVKAKSSYGDITTDSDGATITFDLNASNKHVVTLGGNRTLALSNASVGQSFLIRLIQDGTGNRTVTWFTTIKWPNGVAPTLSTGAGDIDVFLFLCTASGQYDGFTLGQDMS